MMISFALIQPYLALALPFFMPYVADFVASLLQQDGFNQKVNDVFAWAFLILASVGTGIVDNQFFGTPNVVFNALLSIATLLLSGPLTSLKPWINLTAFVQSKLFNVVKAEVMLFNSGYAGRQQVRQSTTRPPVRG